MVEYRIFPIAFKLFIEFSHYYFGHSCFCCQLVEGPAGCLFWFSVFLPAMFALVFYALLPGHQMWLTLAAGIISSCVWSDIRNNKSYNGANKMYHKLWLPFGQASKPSVYPKRSMRRIIRHLSGVLISPVLSALYAFPAFPSHDLYFLSGGRHHL